MGMPYWSLSRWLKDHVKDAVEFIGCFEDAVAEEARRRGVDGVVCGHIHRAEIRQIGEITYCNDGDWVESCTALTEDDAGNLALVHWKSGAQEMPVHKPAFADAAE
jgi:UDP-2,3-diacylglucosamine pyrophosphatase LpxH